MNLIFLECFPNNGKLWLAGADVVVLCFFFLFRFKGGIFENILYLGRIRMGMLINLSELLDFARKASKTW